MNKTEVTDGAERRAHFRVPETLLLDYEAIDEQQVSSRREAMLDRRSGVFLLSSRLHEIREGATVLRHHARQESSVFAKLIDTLEESIDLLAETLMLQVFGQQVTQVKDVNISAVGLDLVTAEGAQMPGTTLDMTLFFYSSGAGLRLFGHVRHCQPCGSGEYRLGVEFEFARDHDRELLVHLMLRREAQLLRER